MRQTLVYLRAILNNGSSNMTAIPIKPTHDWNGASGDNWVEHQVRLDPMLEAFGKAAMAAAEVRRGDYILDVGCGAGSTSFALARQAGPGGHVLGVDISPQLIAKARANTAASGAAHFQLADAATAAFDREGFDLLFSRFGVMFFDDPVSAFRHMRQALKPGGRLAFACWRSAQENDWVRLPMAAIRDLVALPLVDPAAPGPFAFADPGRIDQLLTEAGYQDVVIEPFDAQIPYGHGDTREDAIDDAVRLGFAVGPLARALAGQPHDIRLRAADAVRAAFATCPGDTSILIEGASWIVTARRR